MVVTAGRCWSSSLKEMMMQVADLEICVMSGGIIGMDGANTAGVELVMLY